MRTWSAAARVSPPVSEPSSPAIGADRRVERIGRLGPGAPGHRSRRRGAGDRRLQPLRRAGDRDACATSRRRCRSAIASTRCRSSASSRTCRASPARCATCSAAPSPTRSAAWANTFARLRIDLEQALARERELAPAGRLTASRLGSTRRTGGSGKRSIVRSPPRTRTAAEPAAESAARRDHPRRGQRAPRRAGHPRLAARHPQHAHGRSVGGARPRRLRPGRPADLSAGRGPRRRRRDRRRRPARATRGGRSRRCTAWPPSGARCRGAC